MRWRLFGILLLLWSLGGCRQKGVETLTGLPRVERKEDLGNGKSLLAVHLFVYYSGATPYPVSDVELMLLPKSGQVKTRWLRKAEVEPYRHHEKFAPFIYNARWFDDAVITKNTGIAYTAFFEADAPLSAIEEAISYQPTQWDVDAPIRLRILSSDGRLSILEPRIYQQ